MGLILMTSAFSQTLNLCEYVSFFECIGFFKIIAVKSRYIVSKIRSGPFLVSRTGDEGFNLTFSR